MARLNKVMMKRLTSALDNSAFTENDFKVSFPDTGKVLASATFIPEPHYTFQIFKEENGEIFSLESPGNHYGSERQKVYAVTDGIDRAKDWCKNIKADLRAQVPVIDEFEKLRKEFQAHVDKNEADLQGYFTQEEAADLGKRFDDLIKKFEDLKKKNEVTEKDLDAVRRDLAGLKEDAKTFQKGTFFRTAGNKMFNVCRRIAASKAARTIALETAKEVAKLAVEGKLQLPGA
jgi:hypothetical protein